MRRAVRRVRRGLAIALGALGLVSYTPQLLAFPYAGRIGTTIIRSERPIPAALAATLAEADGLVARSPLYRGPVPRAIFLTDGGWRWRVLSLGTHGSFALRRPLRNVIVVNASDLTADRVTNGRGGVRTLHDTIAHETTHILITDHFGLVRSLAFPTWKVEGYADHVAGTSSLDDAAAARTRAVDPGNASLAYYDARRRVEAVLRRDPSIDRLFLD